MSSWSIGAREDLISANVKWVAAQERHRQEIHERMVKGQMDPETAQEEMAKGLPLATSDVGNFTIRDLADVATNTIWRESDARELVGLKLFPIEAAKLVKHEWTRIKGYSQAGFNGFIGENQRGVTVKPTDDQDSIYLKLMSVESSTSLLTTHQEAYISGLGTQDPAERNRRAAQLTLMKLADMAMFRSRSDTNRAGESNGLDPKGIVQQIEEGTASSPYSAAFGGNGHIVDMKGNELTFDNIRAAMIAPVELFRGANVMLMAPGVKSGLSASLDGAIRLAGSGIRPVSWGNASDAANIGIAGEGQEIQFITSNTLTPRYYQQLYDGSTRPDGYPSSTPTVDASSGAQNDGTSFNSVTDTVTSLFDTNPEGAGTVYYVITYEVDGVESYGTRFPSSGTETVSANQEVAFLVSHPTNATRINVYRSKTDSTTTAMTDCYRIFSVAADASGSTTFFDNNEHRPDTSLAIGLYVEGLTMSAIADGRDADAVLRRLKSTGGGNLGSDAGRGAYNGTCVATLGPSMGMVEMGRTHLTSTPPNAYYRIFSPVVKDPEKNFVFKNVKAGTRPEAARPS